MRAIIETVTCDVCGEVRSYEKYNSGSHVARIESLDEWLIKLGWTVQKAGGLKRIDTCPVCSR